MPAPTDPAAARVRRDGEALVFSGALQRAAITALWPQALAALAGVTRFDLHAVSAVDSAGLALLAELAARAGGHPAIDADPPGFGSLREAYRLGPDLGYAS